VLLFPQTGHGKAAQLSDPEGVYGELAGDASSGFHRVPELLSEFWQRCANYGTGPGIKLNFSACVCCDFIPDLEIWN